MSDLERVFVIRPAYDCIGVQPCVLGSADCKPGAGGSHGRNNALMYLTVRGRDAEVTLGVATGWDLPTVPERHRTSRLIDSPSGRFVEIHTAHPRYEEQPDNGPQIGGTCADWAGCYVSNGFLMADEPTRLLVEKGSDAVWEWLENLYAETQSEMAAVRVAGEGNS